MKPRSRWPQLPSHALQSGCLHICAEKGTCAQEHTQFCLIPHRYSKVIQKRGHCPFLSPGTFPALLIDLGEKVPTYASRLEPWSPKTPAHRTPRTQRSPPLTQSSKRYTTGRDTKALTEALSLQAFRVSGPWPLGPLCV